MGWFVSTDSTSFFPQQIIHQLRFSTWVIRSLRSDVSDWLLVIYWAYVLLVMTRTNGLSHMPNLSIKTFLPIGMLAKVYKQNKNCDSTIILQNTSWEWGMSEKLLKNLRINTRQKYLMRKGDLKRTGQTVQCVSVSFH